MKFKQFLQERFLKRFKGDRNEIFINPTWKEIKELYEEDKEILWVAFEPTKILYVFNFIDKEYNYLSHLEFIQNEIGYKNVEEGKVLFGYFYQNKLSLSDSIIGLDNQSKYKINNKTFEKLMLSDWNWIARKFQKSTNLNDIIKKAYENIKNDESLLKKLK